MCSKSLESVRCCVCDKTFNAGDAHEVIQASLLYINKVIKLYLCSSACHQKTHEWQQAILSEGKGLPCVVCKKVITDMPYEFMFRRHLSQVKHWMEIKGECGYACSPECVAAATGENPVKESSSKK